MPTPRPGDLAVFKWTGPPPEGLDCLFRFIQFADGTEYVHSAIVEKVDPDGTVHLLDMGFPGARRQTVAAEMATLFGDGSVSYFTPTNLDEDQRADLIDLMAEVVTEPGDESREKYAFGDLLIKRALDLGLRREDLTDQEADLSRGLVAALDATETSLCGAFTRQRYEDAGLDIGAPPERPSSGVFDYTPCVEALADLLPPVISDAIASLSLAASKAMTDNPPAALALNALRFCAEQAERLMSGEFTEGDGVVSAAEGRRALIAALAGDLSLLPSTFLELVTQALAEVPPLTGANRFMTAGDIVASGEFEEITDG